MTSRNLKGQTRDPNRLRAQCLENSWRCYLVAITNYWIVRCEAVGLRSAILETAGLLVEIIPQLVGRTDRQTITELIRADVR